MKRPSSQLSDKDIQKFSQITSNLPQLLELIPDNQDDSALQAAELKPLCNLDLRKNEMKVDDEGKTLSPTELFMHHKKFTDLFKVGTFIYKVTDGVAGQTQLNEFIFVQPNPRKPFEKKASASPMKPTQLTHLAQNDTDTYALPYLIACLENISPFGLRPNPIILVLGKQRADGNHENLEIYQSYFAVLDNKTGNISQYKMNDHAQQYGIHPAMTIFHANMHGFQDQHLDSADLEKLFDIYALAIESHRPLIIHCKDGMDRTGALSVAYHILHHWDRIFESTSLFDISKNIKAEHELLQQKRGPGFCVAQKSLLQGAAMLSLILKSIQMTRTLLKEDSTLHALLNGKEYVQQFYILEKLKSESKVFLPNAEKLLCILRDRANLESFYFDEFALEIPHPATTLWNIDKLISSTTRLGSDTQELEFLSRFNRIKNQYRESAPLNESAANELSNLVFDINSQSLLFRISDARKLSPRNQDQHFVEETTSKTDKILASNESKRVKINKLTGVLLRLELEPRIQKIEKMLFEVKLSEEEREIKRNEFNSLKKTIDGHLRSIEMMGVDKRKLMKFYSTKLETFEKPFEVPANFGASPSSGRRRFLSNPPSLKEFKKLMSSSDNVPKLKRRSSKEVQEAEASPTLSKPPSKSGPSSPRKSFFSKPEDTSPKLSRSSAKPTAVSSNSNAPSSSNLFSSSPAIPVLKVKEQRRLTLQQVIGANDTKPVNSNETSKSRDSGNIGVFKTKTPSSESSSPLIGQKSEDSYFM